MTNQMIAEVDRWTVIEFIFLSIETQKLQLSNFKQLNILLKT